MVVGDDRVLTTVICVGRPRVTTMGGPTDLSSEATIFLPSRTEQEKVGSLPAAAVGSITRSSLWGVEALASWCTAVGEGLTLIISTRPAMSLMPLMDSSCSWEAGAMSRES